MIDFSGDGTDPDDGALPASAFTWNVDFLHDGHVHPGLVLQNSPKSGSFTIPSTGHDFSGNTRYRITLTVTDSAGLTNTKSVVVWPQKVNLTLRTVPAGGLVIYLDGIARTTPTVYDTLVGYQHTIEAPRPDHRGHERLHVRHVVGRRRERGHTIHRPGDRSDLHRDLRGLRATARARSPSSRPTRQHRRRLRSTSPCPSPVAQTAGNLNVVVVGWNDTASNVTSVTDSAGNTYELAAPMITRQRD